MSTTEITTQEPSPWSFYDRPTAFVGRVKELHRLREAIRTVIERRHRRAVLLTGSPGIGKSRLLAEFVDSLDEHVDSVTTVAVSCRRDGGPPYSVFQRLLKSRFYIGADDPADLARDKLLSGLSQVLRSPEAGEEAAHFIGHLVGLRFPRSKHILQVDADPRRIEERAVAMFARFLRADAERTPMIVSIDNLHLASDESLSLLLRLSVAVADAPILFLAATRPTQRPSHRAFAKTIKHVGEVIEVTDLSDRNCRHIVAGLLDRAAEVPESFVRMVLEKAFGNPLSIEQIVELHIERGAIEARASGWVVHSGQMAAADVPGTLRDVVRSKLSRFGALERGVLEKAACVGDVLWSSCVGMLRRADEGHTWDDADRFWTTNRRAEELEEVFESLRRRHIVLRNPKSSFARSREYVFKHTVEREVLYESIEGPRRARYHRLIAQWLEAQDSAGHEDLVEHVALHWERGHHPRKAARYYIQAGDRALDRHVNAEAVAFYHKALQCLTDDDAMDRLTVFHKLGQVHMTLGDHAKSLGHFQEMLRLAWTLDDERQGGLAYNKMGRSYRSLGEYDLAIEHFKHGLALFRRVEDVRGIAMSADDIGRVYRMRGELKLAEERIREGLRLRRYLRDERAVAASLHHLGNVHTERGEFKLATAAMREALGLARSVGDKKTVADILTSIAVIAYHRGDRDRALTLWTEALDISRRLGERQLEGVLLNNIGETMLAQSRPEEAQEQLAQAVTILQAVGDRRSLSDALRNQGSCYLQLNNYSKALECSQQALEAATEVGARGLAGMARRNLGEVCSRTLYDASADQAEQIAKAAAHFEASIRDLSEVGLEAELGRARLAYGAFLAETAQDDAAREELTRARALFDRLDMKDCLDRVTRVLEAL